MTYPNIVDQSTRDELAYRLHKWHSEMLARSEKIKLTGNSETRRIIEIADYWNLRGRVFGFRSAIDIVDRKG